MILRVLSKIRRVVVKAFGYNPKQFWNLWALDFDRDNEQVVLHPWNIQAIELIKAAKPDSVLEIGCGFGRNLKVLLDEGFAPQQLCGADISGRMLDKCRRYLAAPQVRLEEADITKLPFADNSFDVVYVSLVLMHVKPESVVSKAKLSPRFA